MNDQAMLMRRSCNPYGWIGLAALLSLFLLASLVFAQATIHRNSFDSKPAWTKGGFDAPYEEISHRIDERDPHNGQGSESIELDAKPGKFIHYVYPVGKAPIHEELRASLWLRNRPGIQLMARLVLPNERDPNNLEYRMTTYIRGDIYQQTGRWQQLEIGRPVTLTKNQQQLMTTELKRSIDFSGVYIDALVLNLHGGPGSTQVWIDDLEIGPVAPDTPFQTAIRPQDNNTPARTTNIPRPTTQRSPVDFISNRLVVGNKRMILRGIRYTDTMPGVLRNAGFNTIFFDNNVNPAVINDATDLGMWIVPEFRVTNDTGSALAPEEITRQIQRYAGNEALLSHRVAGILSYEQAPLVSRQLQIARNADPNHPFSADVWDGLLPYSRSINMLGIHRWPLMTTLEFPKYHEWLQSRKNLANPGIFTWTWIQTHLPDWYAEMLYNQSPLAEFREPVGPQPEQVRLMTYIALASGCRGLGFWSDRFLADSHQGRDRLLSCALLNQEIDMIEPMLVGCEDDTPQWIPTSIPEVKAAVLRCPQGVLVMPIWQGKFSQIVPGQAAATMLSIVVPQVPKTTTAWEVSPGDVRSLKVDRVDKGLKVTLPEFGLTSMIVFTSDTKLVGRFQDQARSRRQVAAQWSYDMALYELEKVIQVQGQLEQVGATLPDAQSLIEDSKRRLQKSKELWDGKNFSAAYHEAQRALRPVRILMHSHWKKAVAGMDSPASSPYAVSFYTLPKHWPFMEQIKSSTPSANVLPGGDFELGPERVQDSWRLDRPCLDEVDLVAERVTELKGTRKEKSDELAGPIEGRQCLMLQMRPRQGSLVPGALERSQVALTSKDVKLPPGTLVQISGWICIPAAITASPDGALMYDSAGGEPMAIRLSTPLPWKKFTVYRRVPASGSIHVTLALTGIGSVYFDDIRIEPLMASNNVVLDNNAKR